VGTQRASRGVSKQQWLEAGLKALIEQGAAGLTIESLARSLSIAKAGFYWHFKNREDLLQQLLEHWLQETTSVVTAGEQLLALEPKARLVRTAEMVLDDDLGRYDMAVRQWALTYAPAARVVRKVNRMRLGFVRDTFGELGFTGDELEMRTMLFVCYHAWESTTFQEISRKRRRGLILKRIDLLTRR
jgi:AcrR family transcriptional regulator